MWAMIPMFRVFSSCVVLATSSCSFPASRGLPAVMREGLVGLGHLVRVFLLLDRQPAVVVGIQDFPRQTVDHRFFGALLREVDHPPERKSESPLGADLDRDLIGRSSHPAGLDLDDGLAVFHGLLEDAYRIFLRLLLDDLHRTVEDFLRDGFLPLAHDPVDHPRNERIAVDRIRPYDPSGHKPSSGHQESLLTVPASSLNKQVATTHGRAPRGAWRPSVTLPPFRRKCRERPVLPRAGQGKLFGSFCSVLRPRLPSVLDTNRIQLSSYDVVPHAGEVLDPASPNQHDGMFLEVVPLARNIDGDLDTVCKPHPGDLPQRGIGLLRGRGVHPEAYPPLLRTTFQRGRVAPVNDRFAPLPDHLVDRRHFPRLPVRFRLSCSKQKRIFYHFAFVVSTRFFLFLHQHFRRLLLDLGMKGRIRLHVHETVEHPPRTGRDEPSHNDVFLQPREGVDPAVNGCVREDLRGLLEGGRRDPGLRGERGLGDPQKLRVGLRGGPLLRLDPLVLLLEHPFLHALPHEEGRVSRVADLDPPEHLPDDDLDVLVAGDGVFASPPDIRHHLDLPLPLEVLAEPHHAVDLGDDGELLGFPRLEELRHAGQATGDVLRFRGLPRDLRDDVAGYQILPFLDEYVRPYGKEVPCIARGSGELERPVFFVLDRDARPGVRVPRLDDHARGAPGHLVELFAHCNSLDDVPELDDPRNLRENRDVVGIPHGEPLPLLHFLPALHHQGRPVGDRVLLPLPVVLVQNDQEAVPVHRDVLPFPVLHHGQALELDLSLVFRLDGALFDEPGGRPADVERPHRELRPGLPDRLRRDDPDRFSDGDHLPACQVAPVTE